MKSVYENLPDTPGVYLMKDAHGGVLYIGKAGNLRRRVSSYFERPARLPAGRQDSRIQKLVSEIRSIDHRQTDTAIEALILEAKLIKELRPPFNVKEKDDKSFLYVEITKEAFPRVLLVRGRDLGDGKRLAPTLNERLVPNASAEARRRIARFSAGFGPFTSAASIREALRILRKIFPWNTHLADTLGKFGRPCFDYEIGLCPGTCVNMITKTEYRKNINNLKLFFGGEKKKILRNLEKEMASAAKSLEFEKAEKLRRRMFALQHIRDVALIHDSEGPSFEASGMKPYRIEGYDISNISGTSAVGSMVVFMNGEPDKNEYRKFRIRTVEGANDVGMMREVLSRRFENSWALPGLILIDGGLGQVNAAWKVLKEFGLKIPLVGIAKGAQRKRNDIIGKIPEGVSLATLIKVRDEAHRFAIKYHKKVRGKEFMN